MQVPPHCMQNFRAILTTSLRYKGTIDSTKGCLPSLQANRECFVRKWRPNQTRSSFSTATRRRIWQQCGHQLAKASRSKLWRRTSKLNRRAPTKATVVCWFVSGNFLIQRSTNKTLGTFRRLTKTSILGDGYLYCGFLTTK